MTRKMMAVINGILQFANDKYEVFKTNKRVIRAKSVHISHYSSGYY